MAGMTNEERLNRMNKIIWAHKEILTGEEAQQLDKWQSLVVASSIFTVLIQIPFCVRYTVLLRRDFEKNKHLLKRIYGLIVFNSPLFFYSGYRAEGLANELAQKYLSDLSDLELCNFEDIYSQMR